MKLWIYSIIIISMIITVSMPMSWADDVTIPKTMKFNVTDTGTLTRTSAVDAERVTFTFDPSRLIMKNEIIWSKGETSLQFDITPIKVGIANITISYGELERFTSRIDVIENEQEEQEDIQDKNIFIPKYILDTGQYKGLIVRETTQGNSIIELSTDTDILHVPRDVVIPDGKNHIMFDLETRGIGKAELIAKIGNEFKRLNTEIVKSRVSDYNIKLYIPEMTSTPNIQVGMYLVDNFNNPVYAEQDVQISLVGTGIDYPSYVIIPEGKSHQFFDIIVHGKGTLTAYTEQTISEKSDIELVNDNIKVNIGVSNELLPVQSFGYIFGWISDDSDVILRPPVPIIGTLQTSIKSIDDRVVSLGDSHTIQDSFINEAKVVIRDGMFYTKFFTHDEGESTITLSVPGYGTVSQDVTVSNTADKEYKSNVAGVLNPLQTPNKLEASVFPITTDGDGFLMVSMFNDISKHEDTICDVISTIRGYTNTTDTDEADETEDTTDETDTEDTDETDDTDDLLDDVFELIEDDTEGCPSVSGTFPSIGQDGMLFTITSQNLRHDNSYIFTSGLVPTQSFMIPVKGVVQGSHEITVTNPLTGSVTTNFEVNNEPKYQISLTTLPHVTGETYPAFLLSIKDDDTVIDPVKTFGELQIELISEQVEFEKDVININKPITIIHGKSDIKFPQVSAIALNENIVETIQEEPSKNLKVEINIPKMVHYGEEFPIYAYLIGDSKPISDVSYLLRSDCLGSNSIYTCYDDAVFYVFDTPFGFENKTIEVFNNEFDPAQTIVRFGDRKIPIGQPHNITTRLGENIEINIISEIPYEQYGNVIVLKPENSGDYEVEISFTRDGFKPRTRSQTYEVVDEIPISITTHKLDGTILNTVITMQQSSNPQETQETPTRLSLPRGPLIVTFPRDISVDTITYLFDRIEADNNVIYSNVLDAVLIDPSDIKAYYKPIVTINVQGGQGGGSFDIGDITELSARDREVVSFLIKEVFDRWSSLPAGYDIYSNPITITVNESFDTVPIYKMDYSGLLMVMIIGIIGIFLVIKRNIFLRR